MQTKVFSFIYNDYTVMAEVELYEDGNIKAIEITQIWRKGKDLLAIYKREIPWAPYVKAWMKETLHELKQYGSARIQKILTDAASIYYEYDFL